MERKWGAARTGRWGTRKENEVERRKQKTKGKKERKVINPTAELFSILEFNLFLENKHSLVAIMGFWFLHLPAPMNIIIHTIRNTPHLD